MTDPPHCPPVPFGLVDGFARTWEQLRGGQIYRRQLSFGTLVSWTGPSGIHEALPDRMYGIADANIDTWNLQELQGVSVNLPPGMTVSGAVPRCETHLLQPRDLAHAWSSLKRVGRQGVRKAEASACAPGPVCDADYLRLCRDKNERLQSPPPSPKFLQALREGVGVANVGVWGVFFEGAAIAVVLYVIVDGYAMLVDGASDASHWPKNPNNLALWSTVEQLVARQAHVIDYGFSPVGAGDRRFKHHMGGTAIGLYRLEDSAGAR